ncbi:MAG: GNAT family N-acetyltransferase [Myxococcaceae bacterium]|nr:GNAT family N-acetyltransferase [Myxococcaceae bacterium]
MSLLVRRLKVMDIPALETLERESVARHPGRAGWLDTYRRHIERSLTEEPEGFLVAELNATVVGGAICRQRGPHALTGQKHGQLLALTAAQAYARYNVAQRLLLESSVYLKSRGCRSMTVSCPIDLDPQEIEVFKTAGFSVVAWELERQL